MTTPNAILSVRNLRTEFHTDQGVAVAVEDLSFDLAPGKTLALVGESGCGKSVTALSVLRLVPDPPGRIAAGEILFEGRDLLGVPEKEMRTLRGNAISMIFQEPMTSMNPTIRVGNQVAAAIRLHRGLSKLDARKECIELLTQVGIPAPDERIDDYPHQMSGGMLQRVMIAMALACNPQVLIADEPTTALDVTIQAQILELLQEIQRKRELSILLITHDLGVVEEVADDVVVMYAGKKMEQSTRSDGIVVGTPQHPYTQGLYASLPAVQAGRGRLYSIPGNVPAATDFPPGCRFHPRCPHAMGICKKEAPPWTRLREGHGAACWLHDEKVCTQEGRSKGIPKEVMS
jgi:peptide/nickel transport system ATP-binding protein